MSEKYANKENLERFWDNAKEYIDNERKEVEDQLYNWQKTEKASVVQCEPVPNSELHPTVNFSFTETPPAEGEKGPENPSTITGVSNIGLIHLGKNFIGFPNSEGWDILTINSDKSITINGTTTGTHINFYFPFNKPLPSGKYTLSFNNNKTSDLIVCSLRMATTNWGNGDIGRIVEGLPSVNYVVPVEIKPESNNALYRLNIGAGTYDNLTIKIQLESGTTGTVYEPIIKTNYTLSLGSTYYGGSLDVAAGVMTVTWVGNVLTGNETVTATQTSVSGLYSFMVPADYYANTGTGAFYKCTHFPAGRVQADTFRVREVDGKGIIFYMESITTGQDFSNFLTTQYNNGTPVTVAYAVKTPFTVQLTPQQIKSLSSLEGTSKRINTIYTDADSVQVEYQKYVGIDSTLNSDSVNAVQNKVVNSALNTKVSLSGDEIISGTKTFSNAINGNITGNASTVAGHIVSKDVPVNAIFTDTTYDPATQSTAGLMSASDKTKLDAVGSVFSFKGSVVNSSSLPASNNVNGDAYLAEDTGHVHVYDGTNFVDIGTWAGIPSATNAQIDALFED